MASILTIGNHHPPALCFIRRRPVLGLFGLINISISPGFFLLQAPTASSQVESTSPGSNCVGKTLLSVCLYCCESIFLLTDITYTPIAWIHSGNRPAGSEYAINSKISPSLLARYLLRLYFSRRSVLRKIGPPEISSSESWLNSSPLLNPSLPRK